MVSYTDNGLPFPAPGESADGPGAFQDLALATDKAYGQKVAAEVNLPAAGLFPGHRIWLVDVKGWAVWSGTAWRTDSTYKPALANGWSTGSTPGIRLYTRGDVGFLIVYYITARGTSDTILSGIPAKYRPAEDWPLVTDNGGGSALLSAAGTLVSGKTGAWSAATSYPLAN